LADLANHESQLANLQPLFRPIDGAFQFYLVEDMMDNVSVAAPRKLFLSYGSCSMPARYLVLFGFCDTSAPYIDAHIDFWNDEGNEFYEQNGNKQNNLWPKSFVDESRMVISTSTGAVSEEVWIAFLYKVLREKDPEALSTIREAYQGGFSVTTIEADQMVESLWEKWELQIGAEIQEHFQHLLETTFAPIFLTERDLLDHPNLNMIVKYNLFMRDCFMKALNHLHILLDPAVSMEDMSTSQASTVFASQYSTNSAPAAASTAAPHQSVANPEPSGDLDSSMDAYEEALRKSNSSW
jgi:hypothetical protein